MVEFEWDEDKRIANIEKHGLDFLLARRLFDGRPTISSSSQRDEETRIVTTGIHDDRYYTVIWTERQEKVRIISFRRARDAEKREYRSIHE